MLSIGTAVNNRQFILILLIPTLILTPILLLTFLLNLIIDSLCPLLDQFLPRFFLILLLQIVEVIPQLLENIPMVVLLLLVPTREVVVVVESRPVFIFGGVHSLGYNTNPNAM